MQKNLVPLFCGIVMLASVNAYSDNPIAITQSEFPLIVSQPEDQVVPFGSNATFTVTAENADGYQWFRNGNPMSNQTNNSLIIRKAGIQDVGYYSCDIFKDMESIPSRSASLMVYTNSI